MRRAQGERTHRPHRIKRRERVYWHSGTCLRYGSFGSISSTLTPSTAASSFCIACEERLAPVAAERTEREARPHPAQLQAGSAGGELACVKRCSMFFSSSSDKLGYRVLNGGKQIFGDQEMPAGANRDPYRTPHAFISSVLKFRGLRTQIRESQVASSRLEANPPPLFLLLGCLPFLDSSADRQQKYQDREAAGDIGVSTV